MSLNNINTIDSLLRYHGDNQGIVQTTMITLRALINAVKEFDAPAAETLLFYDELINALKSSKPKIIPLLNIVGSLCADLDRQKHGDAGVLKRRAIEILSKKLKRYEEKTTQLIKIGATHVEDRDVVMVHMASYVVTNILIRAKTVLGRTFRVIILQQHLMRAKQLIHELSKANIDHVITPNYDVGHFLKKATKLFIAAVYVTQDGKVIVPVGAMNIICACHHSKIPVYLFVNTYHFSDGPSEDLHICAQRESFAQADCRYFLISHSHDIVDLDLFDHIITEHAKSNGKTPLGLAT